jgi:exopolyphosphatase/guanosine-5'-triphosphate,3'-diphosphate pyrophosphatase
VSSTPRRPTDRKKPENSTKGPSNRLRDGSPVAVIDIGSNSGRVVVFRVSPLGHLELIAEARSPLRLASEIAARRRLGEDAIARVIAALRDFTAIATASSAGRVVAVATSAIREAQDGARLLDRARGEAGVDVVAIDGEDEARYAFLGAVYGAHGDHGMLVDLGGGSVEASSFRDRQLVESWTLPLGALRLSATYLRSDPPAQAELEELRDHVRESLRDAGVPPLASDERLIGTGGSIRNLAKIDREARSYPIPRIHGYRLTRERVSEIERLLRSRPSSRRKTIRGLNADRVDSIVGGAVTILVIMETLGAADLTVSGQGVREGVVYDLRGTPLPPLDQVRQASVAALVSRFASWDQRRSKRRAVIAVDLVAALDPTAGRKIKERIEQAATILDIGRSIDYYERHAHAADIVTESDLAGFSHRKLALLAAVIRASGDDGSVLRLYRPLLDPDDVANVSRAAAIIALADEIERRIQPNARLRVRCVVKGREVRITAPLFDLYRQRVLGEQFHRAFGKRLVIDPVMREAEGS